MNNKDILAAIATEIETLSAELLKVNNYIDILGKPAMDKANEIDKALKDAKDRFATALADEQVEARNLRLSRFSDIRVEVKSGDNLNTTGFLIKYKRDTWDIKENASVPKEHECNGFSALDDDAFDYLITEKPQAIPACIMALAPGKPYEAFEAYMRGKQRGYFTGTDPVSGHWHSA
ncbi:hypothetical protein LPN01_12595 [Sphingomonas sp. A2-49]|uniref:hypothetical protein n=1 Tax=Sphingomonas sp. A2-49 TaxID=1391375 RepID=UPI0021CEFF55|nr:hypothetical protein [Sphingomonas sp. A2-49]MCU6454917.1 hypothetical protein [Sphingomonas sp. A2-49]